MAYVEKEGLWLFLTEYFSQYADLDTLKPVIKNPPEDRNELLRILNNALAKVPPVDLEQPTHAVVSYGFEELWDRIVYPEDHNFDMSPFDRVFLEFFGGFRSEIMDAFAEAVYMCSPVKKSNSNHNPRKSPSFPKDNKQRGRPKDSNIQKRRQILRSIIRNPKELHDSKIRLNLFGAFENANIIIPGIGGTDWLNLYRNNSRTEELKSVLETLRKDFNRR